MKDIFRRDKDYMDIYYDWLHSKHVDDDDKIELINMTSKETLREKFSGELKFGTGGIREKIEMGTSRINKYTVRRVTQGIANYMNKTIEKDKKDFLKVAISYDTRHKSKIFAIDTARVFMANNIFVYLFASEKPTPLLAYAVRELECDIGIMITASHNPKEYNGYKVYNALGGQITEEVAEAVSAEINKLDYFNKVKLLSFNDFIRDRDGNLKLLSDEVDFAYIDRIKNEFVNRGELLKSKAVTDNVKIVYTPLNGTGYRLALNILKDIGVKNIYVSKIQKAKDPNFTSVPRPNPEEIEVYKKSLEIAEEMSADLIYANDPDADRLGIMYRNKYNEYKLLSGNIIGVMLTNFILENSSRAFTMDDYIVKTIVTTDMAKKVCENYGVKIKETLTGFKNIGEEIDLNNNNFIFGFEESYGYLKGNYIKDKDGISAIMLFTELFIHLKKKGQRVEEYLETLYKKYGYYEDVLINKDLEDIKPEYIMDKIRKDKFNEISKYKVIEYRDYLNNPLLKKSNVLYYKLDDESFICFRPSGTENKLKIYMNIRDSHEDGVKIKRVIFEEFVEKRFFGK